MVRAKINGKWVRKYFKTRTEAETCSQQKNIEVANQGVEALEFPSELSLTAFPADSYSAKELPGRVLPVSENSGPIWVGGSMGSIPFAPCDPVFCMHHSEIDRIWVEWQAANLDQNPAPAIMDPWTENEVETRDITSLGYSYAQ